MSLTQKKETYVYIRDEKGTAGWIPVIQLPGGIIGKTAIVKVPIYKSDTDLLLQQVPSSKIQYERENRIIDLSSYDNNVLPMQNTSNSSSGGSTNNNNGCIDNYKDMVELSFMHEAAILYNLKLRHANKQPYTRTGDIVFAVNPYQWYTNTLYTTEKQLYYSNRLVWDTNTNNTNTTANTKENDKCIDPRSTMEPHIYEVSALAYKGLQFNTNGSIDSYGNTNGCNQSILVSGESGAGKTETVKLCLNHIAMVQQNTYNTNTSNNVTTSTNPIVQRIIESNPLLEAFGNAQTRRNDNSSRFGKYLQLQFNNNNNNKNNNSNTLVGSKCDVYLLEKNRIVQNSISSSNNNITNERNFHIFYQLLSSSTKTLYWDGLHNMTNESFKYIGSTSTTCIEGINDSDRFDRTISSLQLINIIDSKLQYLIQSIIIVLLLGNISFIVSDSSTNNDNSTISKDSLNNEIISLAKLLGISSKQLCTALTSRTFQTNKECHTVPLTINQAKDSCDALAKEIYERTFLWLVSSINNATAATPHAPTSKENNSNNYRTIGLLDIFGFESFPINGYEQLCINYANEKIQQKFNNDIFASVQIEYENEGITLDDILYDDNTDVIELIENKSYGLLALLNEGCVRPKGNDFDYVQKIIQYNTKSTSNNNNTSNSNNNCLHINKTDRLSFAIHHYAGIVMYTATNFVTKNLDTLPSDLQQCIDQSCNIVICTKIVDDTTGTSTTIKNTNRSSGGVPNNTNNRRQNSNIIAPTVWTKYKNQLQKLMYNLSLTQSRYIRCIKPNNNKKPLIMEHEPVIDQLRCAGVVAAITISRSCFPNRLPNTILVSRYLTNNNSSSSTKKKKKNTIDQCNELMEVLLKCKETTDKSGRTIKAYVVGKTKTYFRAGALEYLESSRSREFDCYVSIIQRMARKWLLKNTGKHLQQKRRQIQKEINDIALAEKEKLRQQQKENDKRRNEHKQVQKTLQQQILDLEKELLDEDKNTKVTLTSIDNQCYAIDCAINCLEGTRKEELELQHKEKQLKKAQQVRKIEAAATIISLLKKENTKLRTKNQKVFNKLLSEEDRAMNVVGNHTKIIDKKDSIGDTVETKEYKLANVKENHDNTHKENCTIVQEINTITDMYTNVALSRQEYQKSMVRILHLVEDHVGSKKKSLTQEIYKIAHSAEIACKYEMQDLEIKTAGATLDAYSTHGL